MMILFLFPYGKKQEDRGVGASLPASPPSHVAARQYALLERRYGNITPVWVQLNKPAPSPLSLSREVGRFADSLELVVDVPQSTSNLVLFRIP